MDFQGDGWLVMAVAAGGAALAATNNALAAIAQLLGWTKASEEKRMVEIDERMKKIMAAELTAFRRESDSKIENTSSQVRQHVASIQRGVEGKQAVMEQRLAEFYREMRDRDEQLANNLHTRISQDIRDAEMRLMRQLETFGKSVSDMIASSLSLRR